MTQAITGSLRTLGEQLGVSMVLSLLQLEILAVSAILPLIPLDQFDNKS